MICAVRDIQLLAIVCVMVSCKMNEPLNKYACVRSSFIMCDGNYSPDEIRATELCVMGIKTVDHFVDDSFIWRVFRRF
jgi:hypothetical protein